MKILKLLTLVYFTSLSACKEFPFTDEDAQNLDSVSENQPESIPSEETTDEENLDSLSLEIKSEDETLKEGLLSEEEITTIQENIELTENTIIQNKRVVLDMVEIKTFEYDLFIIADEFISNHATIQNFLDGTTAGREQNGRQGGSVSIESQTARGELKLILNGEDGGFVPKRDISKRQKDRLNGKAGADGRSAVYRQYCRDIRFPIGLGINTRSILFDKKCWYECVAIPTRGQDGKDGKQGFSGHDGKDGGSSGSFHLKAFNLLDFHLSEIKNIPGKASPGGSGSHGGYGGSAGKNGGDSKNLCRDRLSSPRKGDRGDSGSKGKSGNNGKKGTVCIKQIVNDSDHEVSKDNSIKKEESFQEEQMSQAQEKMTCY